MSNDPFGPNTMATDPANMPVQASKKGCSTPAKIILFICLILFLLVLLCCGGFGYQIYSVTQGVTEDPVEIEAAAQKVADLHLPEAFEPIMALDTKIFFVGQITFVYYEDVSSGSSVVLSQMGGALGSQWSDAIEQELLKSTEEGGAVPQPGRASEVTTRELTVRGKPATFTVRRYLSTEDWAVPDEDVVDLPVESVEGEEESAEEVAEEAEDAEEELVATKIEFTGTFEGKNGPAMLIFVSQSGAYDEETIVELIEAIE